MIAGPFAHDRFHFTTGLRAGEVATIRGDRGEVLLSYRSFAGVTGIVAALVAGIVVVAGLAAVAFLINEDSNVRAIIALAMTIGFAFLITMLVPRTNVTLFDNDQPALTIAQRSSFPSASYIVATPNGATLAELRKSAFSRLGRNRWTLWHDGRFLGEAIEDSFVGALLRKLFGKFSRRFETNVTLRYGGLEAGRIPRKTEDMLELTSDALDRRVAVAVATLVLGREP